MNTARHVGPPEQPADNAAEAQSHADDAEALRTTARQVFEDLSTSKDVASFLCAALVLAGRNAGGASKMVHLFQHADGRVFVGVGDALGACDSFEDACAEVLEELDEHHAAAQNEVAS